MFEFMSGDQTLVIEVLTSGWPVICSPHLFGTHLFDTYLVNVRNDGRILTFCLYSAKGECA